MRHLTPTAAACLLVPVDLSEEPERTLLLSLFCCCTGNIFGVGISLTYIYLTFLSLSTILFFFILFLIIPLVKHFPTWYPVWIHVTFFKTVCRPVRSSFVFQVFLKVSTFDLHWGKCIYYLKLCNFSMPKAWKVCSLMSLLKFCSSSVFM